MNLNDFNFLYICHSSNPTYIGVCSDKITTFYIKLKAESTKRRNKLHRNEKLYAVYLVLYAMSSTPEMIDFVAQFNIFVKGNT